MSFHFQAMHRSIWIPFCQSSTYPGFLRNIIITVWLTIIILGTRFIWLSLVTWTVRHTELLLAGRLSNDGDSFVDGAVIAAARTLPTWSDGDIPPIPSAERKAVKELQDECQQMLAEFPTTSVQDQEILGNLVVQTPYTISWQYQNKCISNITEI